MASKPRPRAQSLDLRKLNEMAEPITVRVYRQRPGQAAEPIRLDNSGAGWDKLQVQQLEGSLIRDAGGGTFLVTLNDSNGQVYEWEFFSPVRSVVQGDVRAEAELADYRARAQHAQMAAAVGAAPPPVGGQPFAGTGGLGAPGPFNPYQQQGFNPMPPGFNPMQPGFNPMMPGFNPMPQGFNPMQGFSPHGMPLVPPSGWGQQPQAPYGYPGWPQPQLPPQIPPAPQGGTDPVLAARLQALEAQNAQLREAEIRRESNAALDRALTEMRASQAQAEARYQQLFDKMMAMNTNRPQAAEEAQRAVEREAQARREEMARIEHQRQLDTMNAEMRRIQEESRRTEERFRTEMTAARESNNNTLMQQLITNQQQAQQQSQAQMLQLLQQANQRDRPADMIALARSMAPTQDPTTQKIMEVAIERLTNPGDGGGPTTAQVVADLGKTVLEQGASIVEAVVDSRSADKREKQHAERRAQQQATQLAQRAQQAVIGSAQQAQIAQQQAAQAQGQAAAQPAADGPRDAFGNPIPPEPIAGADVEEPFNEEEYFGSAFSQVSKLREFVSKGMVKPDRAASALAEAWAYFRSMEVSFPALDDLATRDKNNQIAIGNVARAVNRALPDVAIGFRQRVVDAFPGALAEQLGGVGEEVDGEEPEEEGDEQPAEAHS